jgi:regulator of sigma E protease
VGLRAFDPGSRLGAPVPGMPAEAAGLRPGDRVASVAGKPVETWDALVEELQRRPGETIVLEVVRGDGPDAARLALPITPKDDGGVGRIGVERGTVLVRVGAGAAVVQAVRETNAAALNQLAAFGSVFSKKQRVEGPVGIARQLVAGARAGAEPFLRLVWLISVVLAILNLLPVPALDGGRLVFLGYEIVARRRVSEKVEGYVHFAGFVLLVGLLLAVTIFGDLPRLLGR